MSEDRMTFPDTWEEFEKEYGFTDTEEIYTNGSRLIQSFRVEQWLEHLQAVPVVMCKDCKHRPYVDEDGMIDGDYVCPYLCDDPYYSTVPKDDGFCHRGERK